MSKYSIKDLERISGIKAHTIRIWEKRYKIIEPKRTDTNIRYYDDDELKRLLNISLLNRYGYKISNIAKMDIKELKEKVMGIARSFKDSDKSIENMIVSTLEMDEEKFNKALSQSFFKMDFDEIFLNVIFPFYLKIKLLWQIGTITTAQMYFMKGLIKQKLSVAIDSIDNEEPVSELPFVVFLPEHETIEIETLFYYYAMKKKGFKVIYIGHPMSFSDLSDYAKSFEFKYMLTSFMSAMSQDKLNEYLAELSEALPDKEIYITGSQTNELYVMDHPNIHKIKDFQWFKNKMEEFVS